MYYETPEMTSLQGFNFMKWVRKNIPKVDQGYQSVKRDKCRVEFTDVTGCLNQIIDKLLEMGVVGPETKELPAKQA